MAHGLFKDILIIKKAYLGHRLKVAINVATLPVSWAYYYLTAPKKKALEEKINTKACKLL